MFSLQASSHIITETYRENGEIIFLYKLKVKNSLRSLSICNFLCASLSFIFAVLYAVLFSGSFAAADGEQKTRGLVFHSCTALSEFSMHMI